MRKSKLLLILLLGISFSCSSPSDKSGIYMPEELDRRDKMRYQQYLVQGKMLYLTHCSNCHQPDGQGFRKIYPPLVKADYLLDSLGRAACAIRYGMQGPIKVNGVEYNMPMPGIDELQPLEIAEILTYIGNSWGNESGFIEVQDVQRYLRYCDP